MAQVIEFGYALRIIVKNIYARTNAYACILEGKLVKRATSSVSDDFYLYGIAVRITERYDLRRRIIIRTCIFFFNFRK